MIPHIDWVSISGGLLVYQGLQRRKRVEPFHIARYPVTNAQFLSFLDTPEGYRKDRWWAGLTNPWRVPQDPRWSGPSLPRETVSWHEAMAFCAWLTDRLGAAAGGWVVRLPTEVEWERAAAGPDGRAYPWGNSYLARAANLNEILGGAGPNRRARTSPVGSYPLGASPEGVLDLAGNVWEWCLNEFQRPGRTGPAGDAQRAMRGGSWASDTAGARADACTAGHPAYRSCRTGFRVVLAAPMPRRGGGAP